LVLTDARLRPIEQVRQYVEAQNQDVLKRLGTENAKIVQEALRTLS